MKPLLTSYIVCAGYPDNRFRFIFKGADYTQDDYGVPGQVIDVDVDTREWRVYPELHTVNSDIPLIRRDWNDEDDENMACAKADMAAAQWYEIPDPVQMPSSHGRHFRKQPAVQELNYQYETELPNDQIIAHRPSLCALCVAGDHSCRDRFCDCDCCMRLHG